MTKETDLMEYRRKIADDIADEIEVAHRRALYEIQKDIAYYLDRIAVDNHLSYEQARQLLTRGELEALRMTYGEYMGLLDFYPDIDDVADLALKNASNSHEITRLQAIEIQVKRNVDRLYQIIHSKTEKMLKDTYRQIFYQELFSIQSVQGYARVDRLDDETLWKIINVPWSKGGKNYSDAIWDNREKVNWALDQVIGQSTIRGDDIERAVLLMEDRLQISANAARRLLHTENGYMQSRATRDAIEESPAEYYQIDATLDTRTSDICRDMDGKKIKVEDWDPGATAPPFHPNCRTVIMPSFDDDIERRIDEKAGRAMRKDTRSKWTETGNLTYRQWENQYVM